MVFQGRHRLADHWGSTGLRFGTLTIAATNLADIMNTRKLFAISAVGFLITIVPIWLVSVLAGSVGWGSAFAMLAIGPALGTAAMLRLRTMPESAALALGRR